MSVVCLKQSGERFAKGSTTGEPFHPEGTRAAADKIMRAMQQRVDLDIDGMLVVPGGGNLFRGEELRARGISGRSADFLGRIGTVANAAVLSDQLTARMVPHLVLVTDRMKVVDASFKAEKYTTERMGNAFADGMVVVIGGGTGEDNVTTDNAVVSYAADFRSTGTDTEVMILKGTQFDGVFDQDPAIFTNPPRLRTISAAQMLDNHESFGAVDAASLRSLMRHDMSMLVYADGGHDLETVLRHYPGRMNGDMSSIGTVIVGHDVEAEYYTT
ncbi:hypothetical protein KDA23_05260 [Candidatus Saccharibacteria bacterium]|nr:hypothetical protein [Candidatus Saccharibacteria bacterium]